MRARWNWDRQTKAPHAVAQRKPAFASGGRLNGVPALVTGLNFKGNGLCGTPDEDCIPPQNNPSDISMVLNSYFVEYDAPLPLSDLIDSLEQ